MTKRTPPARLAGFSLTSDGAIGAAGCCLAVGALAFGVYMNVHGPSAGLGTSKEFSVFAQLAPRAHREATPARTDGDVDLDTASTASIRGVDTSGGAQAIIPSISLAVADADAATLMIEGRARRVRVGDDVPGAGEVLAIVPGARPMVRTARGLIVPAAEAAE